MRKVRWGVIGCGGIARTRTIPGMLLAENAQLVSVMARDLASAQAVQEQFGADRAYDSAEQLLKNDDLDAVCRGSRQARPVRKAAGTERRRRAAHRGILSGKGRFAVGRSDDAPRRAH